MKLYEGLELFMRRRAFEVRPGVARDTEFRVRKFCLFAGPDRDTASLEIEDVLAYIRHEKARGLKHNNFVSIGAFLRVFFRFLQQSGLCRVSPELVPIARPEIRPKEVPDEKTYAALLEEASRLRRPVERDRERCFLAFLWDTGARLGEILSLDIKDLDLGRRRAIISTAKSRGRRPFREIFWTTKTAEILSSWLITRRQMKFPVETDALFICTAGRNSGSRMGTSGAGAILTRLTAKAGVRYFSAHRYRHRMGHHIIKQGGSTADVMNILGHSNLERSTIYTMMESRELNERYRELRGKKDPAFRVQ